jgi:two-component system, chemotaxis family, sensor kinase Cph1
MRILPDMVATVLHRSLRPERLPAVAHGDFGACYLPAGNSRIGGDWYEAVELPGGRVMLAIGDVAGHGVEAASFTTPLRHSFRAYALEGLAPAEIAERLNLLFEGDFATFLCLEIDCEGEHVRFANAGHLPPLVIRADGETDFLDGVSRPLGTGLADDFDQYEARFEAGSTLLVYTDGLVERRSKPIDAGLAWLAETGAAASVAPGELVERLVCDLDPSHGDDVAVVAFRSAAAVVPRKRFDRARTPLAA